MLDKAGIGYGLGPLGSDSFRCMACWYDRMPEWPHLALPKRLTKLRRRRTRAKWDKNVPGAGKALTFVPKHFGEGDVNIAAEVHGAGVP